MQVILDSSTARVQPLYGAGGKESSGTGLKQPRRRRQQKPHKFAYLTMENSIFARFARAYFIF